MINHILVRYYWLFAFIGLIACIYTWYLELSGQIYSCPYCQVQRAMLGILSLLVLIKPIYPRLFLYISLPVAIFGIDIAGDQIFFIYKNGNFPNLNSMLAIGAFTLLVLLEIILVLRTKQALKNNLH
ncbi:disulfide bond formation protein B [Facilibium subflavum]|uniref:disulfide bond formation protein B n=1 Tax=Facilibium subflavum TaxID=2219058 RepID=UPI0013C32B0A|nr:disulfide bond formation protein B [Facilibium subflavum]